jgi:putative redox protein
MSNIEISLALANQKVGFTGISQANPSRPIDFDYSAPLGDGQGFAGLELLAMSFAGCVSTALVVLLRRTGKNFSDYKMKITGIQREQPLSLEKIIAEVNVSSDNLEETDIQEAIEISRTISPVWLALINNVEVEIKYNITRLP